MKGHETCVHCHPERGVMYCTRTHLVYVRADMLPTEPKRKIRGTDFEAFARKAAAYYAVLRDTPLAGFLMLRSTVALPEEKPGDLPSLAALVKLLRKEQEAAT